MTPETLRATLAERLSEIAGELGTATDAEASVLCDELDLLSPIVDEALGLSDAGTLRLQARVDHVKSLAARVSEITEELQDPDLGSAEEADYLSELENCRDALDELSFWEADL